MNRHGKGGPDTVLCGEEGCGQLLYWDPIKEVWLHELTDGEGCILEGHNAPDERHG